MDQRARSSTPDAHLSDSACSFFRWVGVQESAQPDCRPASLLFFAQLSHCRLAGGPQSAGAEAATQSGLPAAAPPGARSCPPPPLWGRPARWTSCWRSCCASRGSRAGCSPRSARSRPSSCTRGARCARRGAAVRDARPRACPPAAAGRALRAQVLLPEDDPQSPRAPKLLVASGGLTGFGVAQARRRRDTGCSPAVQLRCCRPRRPDAYAPQDLLALDFSAPEEAPEQFRAIAFNAHAEAVQIRPGLSGLLLRALCKSAVRRERRPTPPRWGAVSNVKSAPPLAMRGRAARRQLWRHGPHVQGLAHIPEPPGGAAAAGRSPARAMPDCKSACLRFPLRASPAPQAQCARKQPCTLTRCIPPQVLDMIASRRAAASGDAAFWHAAGQRRPSAVHSAPSRGTSVAAEPARARRADTMGEFASPGPRMVEATISGAPRGGAAAHVSAPQTAMSPDQSPAKWPAAASLHTCAWSHNCPQRWQHQAPTPLACGHSAAADAEDGAAGRDRPAGRRGRQAAAGLAAHADD